MRSMDRNHSPLIRAREARQLLNQNSFRISRIMAIVAISGFAISGFAATLLFPAASRADEPSKDVVPVLVLTGDRIPDGRLVGKPKIVPGPRPSRFPAFLADNQAIAIPRGSHIRIADEPDDDKFDFDNGDTITVSAWVRLDSIADHAYIVGKGRGKRSGPESQNQNWAVRFRKQNGAACLNFLFRSRKSKQGPANWHRWTSKVGVTADGDWHQVFLRYEFGAPEKICGVLDGKVVSGKWDMGGATTNPPVVDESDLWIGSAMDGAPGNSLNGAIDELHVYRGAIPESKPLASYQFVPREIVKPKIPANAIAMELFGPHGSYNSFPLETDKPRLSWRQDTLAFTRLPNNYDDSGVRADWTNKQAGTMLVRAWTRLDLKPGDYQFMIRSRGLSKLTIDGNVIGRTPAQRSRGGAHHVVDPIPAVPVEGMRPHYMNDHERIVEFHSDGGTHEVRFEFNAGAEKFCLRVGETSVSMAHEGQMFHLLSPQPTLTPLTDSGWSQFVAQEKVALDLLDRTNRRAAAKTQAVYWQQRHADAQSMVSADTAQNDSIDSLIESRIDAHNNSIASRPTLSESESHYLKVVRPIFEKQCLRCHGEKQRGGLQIHQRDNLLAGGESGEPAIVPGKPQQSLLFQLVTAQNDEHRMPPEGDGLSANEQAAIKAWIKHKSPMPQEQRQPVALQPSIDDHSFLRRIFIDTVGVVPTLSEIDQFFNDPIDVRRERVINRLLADSRWADNWVGYWQDVLAENPNLLKPKLNNTGPFRFWIYDALEDNKPLDQFATELITMRGSKWYGGAAGFSEASLNDAPMASKAHVIGTAFLGVEMKCARCHDAPYHKWQQSDLFQMAAMLNRKPITLPASSTVPVAFFEQKQREPLISATLKPGDKTQPTWPLPDILNQIRPAQLQDKNDSREQLAVYITSSRRFAEVMANRIWKRLMGAGIVEPVHDWHGQTPSDPALLEFLADQLIRSNYDQRQFARLIFNSRAYQRVASPLTAQRFFAGPGRRRMTAEQIVDSALVAVGQPMRTEILALDLEGTFKPDWFFNFGQPQRAWELTTLANERDRPSLALPRAQAIADVLKAFGWRNYRAEPISTRDVTPNLVQPGALANGTFGAWLTRLSDQSELTTLALSAKSPDEFVDALFLRLLTRAPTPSERHQFVALLSTDFSTRRIPSNEIPPPYTPKRYRNVSWSNHLNTEANTIKIEMQAAARAGDPPSRFLKNEWRQRAEDAVWALVNNPEMILIP